MPMYGVQRSEKYKRQDISGIEKEATRKAKHYNNDVDVNKSQHNMTLIDCDNWLQKINDTIKATGVKTRKDNVVAIGSVYTATGEFFNRQAGETKQEWNNRVLGYFKDCLAWHVKTYCQGNKDLMLSAVIHVDETTLHMQAYSIPILERDGKYALTAHSIMGNKKAYTERVDSFYNEVSKKYGLERGERTPEGQTAKKHIETQRHKLNQLKRDLTIVESDKIFADMEKKDAEQQLKNTEAKNQKLQQEHNQLQEQIQQERIQLASIKSDIDIYKFDKQALHNENKKLMETNHSLEIQIKKLQNEKQKIQELQNQSNTLKSKIEQQNSVIERNNKKISKQKQDIKGYDDLKQTLAEVQDWLSKDTYFQTFIDSLPEFLKDRMPRGLEIQQHEYYNNNIEPFEEYANKLANDIQDKEQYIDDEEIDL